MSTPIGFNGLKRIAEDSPANLTFPLVTSVSKVQALNPDKAYDVFLAGAGPADITIQVTSDSRQAIADGTCMWGPVKSFTAVPAAGGYINVAGGSTAARVTHIKNGAGTDDAPTVAKLGGRFQARFVAKQPGTGSLADADNGLFGDYTPLT